MPIIPRILEKFENMFKIRDFLSKNNIKISDISLIKFSKIEGDSKTNVQNNIFIIDPKKLNDGEKKIIKGKIIDVEIAEDSPILKEESKNITDVLKDNIPKGNDAKVLEFYKNKLPEKYLCALEAALFIRNMAFSGEDISFAKKDLVTKYPHFGRNLCNLASEKYFHGHFQDLYKSMSIEEDFNIVDYQKQVKKIIIGLPYTVFVSSVDTVKNKTKEVIKKIKRLKQYGAGKILIHAINNENVSRTEKIIDSVTKSKDIQINDIDVDKTKKRITITIYF